ncbi:GatB/YqeY domain-containing protein [Bauldia litoralis]|uniref:GatB/YqeY domain-containing protein n=2 Tax=Hyphomicrobiales TaxID=356 RepID=UPI003266AF3B
MREQINAALKQSTLDKNKRKVSTLRLINAAILDRDIAARGAGRDPVSDEDILEILTKMIRQRLESAKTYEEGNRLDLAEQELEEISIIKAFLPEQLDEDEVRSACADLVKETNAKGLRDIGRCMQTLKSRYQGRMDFGKASTVVKGLLS